MLLVEVVILMMFWVIFCVLLEVFWMLCVIFFVVMFCCLIEVWMLEEMLFIFLMVFEMFLIVFIDLVVLV